MAEESAENKQRKLEPIGLRVMGSVDPTTLTQEQLRSSPDLLFHGAVNPITLSSQFDYDSEEYLKEHDGSQTLGEGFYSVSDREIAEGYSQIRQTGRESGPMLVVIEFLPYQARMLDLRAKTDPTRNAPLPRELFIKWSKHFQDYYSQTEARRNLARYVQSMEEQYSAYLLELQGLPAVDLRVMLGTSPTRNPDIKSLNYPSPPWMRKFAEFMKKEGYDGLVYIEGEEAPAKRNHDTYVFYNVDKIDSFAGWQQKKTS